MNSVFAVVNWIGLVLFSYFAYLQINDANPAIYHRASQLDAYLWMAFYILVAAVFLLAMLGRFPLLPLAIATVFCIVELALTIPGFIENISNPDTFTITGAQMAPDAPKVELSREFLGSLIALAGMAIVWWQRGRSKAARA